MIFSKTIVKKVSGNRYVFSYDEKSVQGFYESFLEHLMENDGSKLDYFLYLAHEKIDEKIDDIRRKTNV